MPYTKSNEVKLFANGDIRAAVEGQRKTALKDVDSYDGNKLLNSSVEDLISYFSQKYQINRLKLNENEITMEDSEAQIDVSHDAMIRFFADRDGPIMVPGMQYAFHVPFDGDKNFFTIQPNMFGPVPPRAIVTENEIVILVEDRDLNPEKIKSYLDGQILTINRFIECQNIDIDQFNATLPGLIRQHIDVRRQRLLTSQGTVAALGFPVRRRESSQTYAVPTVRRKISIVPPPATSAPYVPEPTLAASDYENILTYLDDLCRGLEQSPSTYAHMGEEQIRDQFLVALNATFEGRATGETFNKSGKTDILIREKNANVFVAECKFWGGEKKLIETIDQLLGYLTWRDTKTAVILFNKNKNLTAVLDKVEEAVPTHSNFKKALGKQGDSNYRYLFSLPEDRSREVHIAVMVFDVPEGK